MFRALKVKKNEICHAHEHDPYQSLETNVGEVVIKK